MYILTLNVTTGMHSVESESYRKAVADIQFELCNISPNYIYIAQEMKWIVLFCIAAVAVAEVLDKVPTFLMII